jgi:acyl-CoA thioester hydrolase
MVPYEKQFTIRWSDCDANGHARNTAYSEYAVDVRMAYLAEHGFPYEKMVEAGVGPILTREEIEYRRELMLGETVAVDFELLGLTADRTRFRFVHRFTKAGGKPAARIVVDVVWMDMRTRRVAPPPPALAEALASVPRADGWAELPGKEGSR